MSDCSLRLQTVRERIARAANASGRDPESVTLIAVSKTRSPGEVIEVLQSDCLDLGENYVQELIEKKDAVEVCGFAAGRWHLIGHLQTNKVKYVTPFCHLIHSVDSIKLAREIDKRAAQHGRVQPILLQVNIAEEATKTGAASSELTDLALGVLSLPNIDLQGLMVIPPPVQDPEQARPHYRRTRQLAERLQAAGVPAANLRQLSMGMTGDFEVAVEEGATLVRIGTAIFGPRGPLSVL